MTRRRAYFPKRPIPPPPPVPSSCYERQVIEGWERWTSVINRNGGRMPEHGTPDRREACCAATLMQNADILRRRALEREARDVT